MKNVTGYDLSKLMAGSFGTLAVLDQITLKTLPRPETSCSLIVEVADFAAATSQIADLFATPHEPASAAILPANLAKQAGLPVGVGEGSCVIIIRLEGISISVANRLANLQRPKERQTLAGLHPGSQSRREILFCPHCRRPQCDWPPHVRRPLLASKGQSCSAFGLPLRCLLL